VTEFARGRVRASGLKIVGLLLLLAASGAGPAALAQGDPAKPAPTPAKAGTELTAAATQTEPAVLETADGKLYGALEIPARARAPYPVVLIISGSGPTDRDGNSAVIPGANNGLKYLAEGLAAEGIASLRYDKRGIAASAAAGGDESGASFDKYIADAVLWGQRLRADKRFAQLFVAGHSEGSLVGMVAAQRLGAEGYVSIAGPGRRIDAVILEQLKPQFSPEVYAKTEAVLKSLAEGKTVADTPPELAALFRPSAQPYLISWLKYDPAAEVAKLKSPVLVAQGTHDLQVKV
jgi:pimeloyl-ACP methyl ester carboxylesterase